MKTVPTSMKIWLCSGVAASRMVIWSGTVPAVFARHTIAKKKPGGLSTAGLSQTVEGNGYRSSERTFCWL